MRLLVTFFIFFCAISSAWSETFVVCIGIANYADEKVPNLAKTERDAKAVAEFYKRGTDNVIIITGKYATKAQILKSLRSQFARAKEGDRIVFFFSGHGYPGGFCPYEMKKITDGITYGEVINIMAQSKARDKFLFADACNSGAIRQKQKSSKPDVGSVLFFLSSRGNEYSSESALMANGYFTKYLLKGLGGGADANRDKKITASELFKYVSEEVQTQTKGEQHPVMWGKFPDDLIIVRYDK